MEEKASLMVASQKKSADIDKLMATKEKLQQAISVIPGDLAKKKAELEKKQQLEFFEKRDTKLASIENAVAQKRTACEELLDSFPDADVKDFAGKMEVKSLEAHLKEIYPENMINTYVCFNPIIFKDEGEAFKVYRSIENMIMGLRRGNFAGSIFNGLTALLNKAAANPAIGLRVSFGVVVFIVGGLFLSPFLFIMLLSSLGFICGSHGFFVYNLLRRLYSVKAFLNESYDEDIFRADKADIMESVNDFLDEAERTYCDLVNEEKFVLNTVPLDALQKKSATEEKRLKAQRDLVEQQLLVAQKELEDILTKIEELMEQEKKFADRARAEYLGKIDWQPKWMELAFLDVTQEHKVKAMPFNKGNSLYYSKDIDKLRQLSRLLVYQSMIKMHPDFACTMVLDYKYNGGDLTQFVTVPERLVKICYIDEDLTKQSELISNKIRSRTNTILGSCQSIEEYNELMASFSVPGEYYVIVHVFGISNLNNQWLNNIRNGTRVGFFFKFYCTLEELSALNDVFPYSDIMNIFEVTENPIPRGMGALQRALDKV